MGIKVVVESTTDTERFGQMDRTVATERGRQVNTVRGRTEGKAVARSKLTGNTAQHQERRRSARGGDDLLCITLCPGRIELDVVTSTGRKVLDLQRGHHRAAPLGIRMARQDGIGQSRGTRDWDTTSAKNVVRGVDLMQRARNLEQTPCLIEADVADEVRRTPAAVNGIGKSEGSDTERKVVQRGAVEHGRIIEAEGAGYALGKLGGLLDVVDASDAVVAADQE